MRSSKIWEQRKGFPQISRFSQMDLLRSSEIFAGNKKGFHEGISKSRNVSPANS
jgi:hypothetical protein